MKLLHFFASDMQKVIGVITIIVMIIIISYKLSPINESSNSTEGFSVNDYEYMGAYNDFGNSDNRTIPIQVQNVVSVDHAKRIALAYNASVFGIQFGGSLFIGNDYDLAISRGPANCSEPLGSGCSWINQVYRLKDSARAGLVGAQGPAGKDGAQGPAGKDGDQGPAGKDGAQGPAGAPGAQGSPGAQGAQGAPGAPGAQGPQGLNGQNGDMGPTGPTGPSYSSMLGETNVPINVITSNSKVQFPGGEPFNVMEPLTNSVAALSGPASYY